MKQVQKFRHKTFSIEQKEKMKHFQRKRTVFKSIRYVWMRLRYRLHLVLRKGHDKLFAKKKLYYRYHSLPAAKHINRALKVTVAFSIALFVVYSLGLFRPMKVAASSVYSWVQGDWSGGADTSNFPSHPGNKTGWQKYYSKDTTITANGSGVSLSSPSTAITDNTTALFGAGTQSNTSATNNEDILLKPLGATATNTWECASQFISGGVCAWGYAGRSGSALAGKMIFPRDLASTDKYFNGNALGTATPMWKTANTSCASPQCSTTAPVAETYSGYTGANILVADNTVNFNPSAGATPDYPARDACKALGGRLPTIAELEEMYNYKSSYGNNFQSASYWSEDEYSSSVAYVVHLTNGNVDSTSYSKTNGNYVRCVR
jgi:hypothetical protein